MDRPLLDVIETYYDAAPRPHAATEEVGGFTLFLRTDPRGWPYYARPRLGLDQDVTADDVRRVRDRQRQLGVPEKFEWVHQTTPSLLPAARAAGLSVEECPLLTLPAECSLPPAGPRAVVIDADDEALPWVLGAIHAGFEGSDSVQPSSLGSRPEDIAAGRLVIVAAYDEDGVVVGGGSHGPRGDTTELTGIAVVPRARRRGLGAAVTGALVADARRRGLGTVFLSAQDDAVARVYERVGFVRIGTASLAEPT